MVRFWAAGCPQERKRSIKTDEKTGFHVPKAVFCRNSPPKSVPFPSNSWCCRLKTYRFSMVSCQLQGSSSLPDPPRSEPARRGIFPSPARWSYNSRSKTHKKKETKDVNSITYRITRSRRSLRTPNTTLEPKNETVYLRSKKWYLYS